MGTCKKHENNLHIGLVYSSPGQETLFLSWATVTAGCGVISQSMMNLHVKAWADPWIAEKGLAPLLLLMDLLHQHPARALALTGLYSKLIQPTNLAEN